LHERLRGIARRRAALDAEEARCLREAHDIRLWRRLGYAHMNEYFERELGYSPRVGVERLRVALASVRASVNTRASVATIDQDARTALVTAGYRPQEARVAVELARPHVGDSASLEQVIREALRRCAPRATGMVSIR
jgi:hypothetical protein